MSFVKEMFKDIIISIGMKLHCTDELKIPMMVSDKYAGEGKPHTMGCSIAALLTTSTATVHTTYNTIYLDIFSCKGDSLMADKIINSVSKYFQIVEITNNKYIIR
jgi:hypothetical protein